jgi:RNA polymerase sigma factor (sigma-70 family)
LAAAIENKVIVPAELERLFTAHHVRALKAAYRITGNMTDAEDVAQTVFLRIAQSGAAADAMANPESYIYRAAINGALDTLRKRRSDKAVSLEEVPLGALPTRCGGDDAGDISVGLRQALASLSPRAAEMFVLRYIEEYDNSEIARMLKTSRAVVAVILHRTRARLRHQLRAKERGTR